MVLSRDKVEVIGALRLPLGGVNGYVGVRSRQGYTKDKFQGTTPTMNVLSGRCDARPLHLQQSRSRVLELCRHRG